METTHLSAFIRDSTAFEIPLTWEGEAFSPGAEWVLMATVKKRRSDPDSAAVFQKTSGAGITATGSTATLATVPDDTDGLHPRTLYGDIRAQSIATEERRTVARYDIEYEQDLSRETETSIPVITTETPLPFATAAPVITSTTPPEDHAVVWFDPETGGFSLWYADAWVAVGEGGASGGAPWSAETLISSMVSGATNFTHLGLTEAQWALGVKMATVANNEGYLEDIYVETDTGYFKCLRWDGLFTGVQTSADYATWGTAMNSIFDAAEYQKFIAVFPCNSAGTILGNITVFTAPNTFLTHIDARELSSINDFNAGNSLLTHLDFSGLSGVVDLSVAHSSASPTSLVVTNFNACPLLAGVYFTNCGMTQAMVDYILVTLAANSTTGGYVDLAGNAAPSAASAAAIAHLEETVPNGGLGWTVVHA